MKVQLTIPNNLNEVTLGQYQEYLKLENLTQTELSFKMIEIFCKLDTKAVRSLKATDIKEIAQIITDMFEGKPGLVHSFKLGGTEYGFINNLDEMTFGEYIDLDTYIGDWENIEKAMGVLYRPIKHRKGGRYVIEDYEAKDAGVAQFGVKYGWYSSLYALAKSDIRRFEDITKLNMHECLMFLTFEKEKNKLEASNIKKKF